MGMGLIEVADKLGDESKTDYKQVDKHKSLQHKWLVTLQIVITQQNSGCSVHCTYL